eukprot:1142859-Pelagomonas_calceolata.AAC.9
MRVEEAGTLAQEHRMQQGRRTAAWKGKAGPFPIGERMSAVLSKVGGRPAFLALLDDLFTNCRHGQGLTGCRST